MLLNFDDGCLCIKKCYVSAYNVNDKCLFLFLRFYLGT